MKQRLANPVLADRGARFAGVGFTDRLVPRLASAFPTAQASHQPCAEPAAPSGGTSLDGAAFRHFTESGGVGARGQDEAAPVVASPAGAVSSASLFILRLIAAHDGRSERDTLARLIAEGGEAIGLSSLLAGAGERLGDDLHDLPNFARSAQMRCRGAREADGNFQGTPSFALRASEGRRT